MLPLDSRDWFYFPIYFPLNKDGEGPETRPGHVTKDTWEVWDRYCFSHATFDNLYCAINKAMELTLADPTGERAFDR